MRVEFCSQRPHFPPIRFKSDWLLYMMYFRNQEAAVNSVMILWSCRSWETSHYYEQKAVSSVFKRDWFHLLRLLICFGKEMNMAVACWTGLWWNGFDLSNLFIFIDFALRSDDLWVGDGIRLHSSVTGHRKSSLHSPPSLPAFVIPISLWHFGKETGKGSRRLLLLITLPPSLLLVVSFHLTWKIVFPVKGFASRQCISRKNLKAKRLTRQTLAVKFEMFHRMDH